MTVIVEGVLTHSAEKRTAVIGQQALVVLDINVGPGYPAEARLPYADDHLRATAVALGASRGARVRIEAAGFFPRVDHSTAAVVLTNVSSATINDEPVFP